MVGGTLKSTLRDQFSAYSLAYRLAVSVETRPNQVTPQLLLTLYSSNDTTKSYQPKASIVCIRH